MQARVCEVDPAQARVVVEAGWPVQDVDRDRHVGLGLQVHPVDEAAGTHVQQEDDVILGEYWGRFIILFVFVSGKILDMDYKCFLNDKDA